MYCFCTPVSSAISCISVRTEYTEWFICRQEGKATRWVGRRVKKFKNLVSRRSGRIAQGNELSRRIFGRRERRVRVGIYDRQHLAAANSPNGQSLALHRDHPILFVKDCALGGLHSPVGCRILGRRLRVCCHLFPFRQWF